MLQSLKNKFVMMLVPLKTGWATFGRYAPNCNGSKKVRVGKRPWNAYDVGQLSVGTVAFDSLIFKPHTEARKDKSSRKIQRIKIWYLRG